ncbi:MAG: hypothetical protein HZB33_15795 [Nitrospirae bacterium]|nr:hypothetical protein [Nitrospirota bacterium]
MAEKELGSTLVIISKLSGEYLAEDNPPPCPSVAVGTTLVVKDGTISYDVLKTALCDKG